MIKKPFKYPKTRKPPSPELGSRITPYKEKEQLTGYVQDQEASDIEERFANALYKNPYVDSFEFREFFFAPIRNIAGVDEVDFIVHVLGTTYMVEIDGAYAHKTLGQRSQDLQKDAVLNSHLSGQGIPPVIRIPDGVLYPENSLDSQESTNRIVMELFS